MSRRSRTKRADEGPAMLGKMHVVVGHVHQAHSPPFKQYPFGESNRSSSHPPWPPPGRNPFSSPHVRRATGRRTPFERGEDRLRKEPVAVRIGQVLGLMFFIVALSGGLGTRG
ncbi:hypothetical protein JB92DRAFT_3217946 [Gautieria morchelliformis]|nr:hypothetical protein JB92DRAFT_3217946 [Gautieria morchelliformis]